MNTFIKTIDSLWQVLLVALLLGAGLPAVFAVGLRALAGVDGQRTPGGRMVGVACLAFVVAAVVTGILYIMKDFLAHSFDLHLL